MHAMVLNKIGAALEWAELADPQPGPGEIRVKVAACGVCRTDLHVVDGELPDPKVPIIPGHEIVGRIDLIGAGVKGLKIGERVGIPWLGHTCGVCPYCIDGSGKSLRPPALHRLHPQWRFRDGDNCRCALCLSARRNRSRCGARPVALRWPDWLAFAGHRWEGQKDWPLRLWRCSPYPGAGGEVAGAIRVLLSRDRETRPHKISPSNSARVWAGGSDEMPPEPLDAAIIFATVGHGLHNSRGHWR